MVDDHIGVIWSTVKSSGYNLMNTDITRENHIASSYVLGAESPDIIPFAETRTWFGKSKNGAVVTGQILTIFVFALHLTVECLKEIMIIHIKIR